MRRGEETGTFSSNPAHSTSSGKEYFAYSLCKEGAGGSALTRTHSTGLSQAYPKFRRRLASQAGARKAQRAHQLPRSVNLPRLQVEKQAALPRSWVHRPGCRQEPSPPTRVEAAGGLRGLCPVSSIAPWGAWGGATRGPAGVRGGGRSPCCCPLGAAAAAPRRQFHRL